MEALSATLALGRLYQGFGYQKYTMSQFEEYGFYLQYKRFLPSDKILSFTDLDGRLMALKPDVTPSIIKNVKEGEAKRKVYYTETVYRENRQSSTLREIHQMGLECIGTLSLYDICETVLLAKRSLETIGSPYVFELGHMGFVTGLFEALGLSPAVREEVIACVSAKSPHEAQAAALRAGAGQGAAERLSALCALCGPFDETLARASALCLNRAMEDAVEELAAIGAALTAAGQTGLRLDFTLLNDTAFYDGVLLAGYVEGVSRAVLSGGRYDGMLHQMGKTAGAVGFAVYLSELEHLDRGAGPAPCDLVLENAGASPAQLLALADQAVREGKTVRVLSPGEAAPPAKTVRKVGPTC